jgi:TRAP-type mannitol/chloroaromatic compound transport system permease small subunit
MASLVEVFRRLEKSIRGIETVVGYIGMALLVIMACLGTADVIGRYLFNHPLWGTMMITGLMMGILAWLGWAYTLVARGHITVDLIFIRYPARAQAIASFIAMVLSLGIFSLFAWRIVGRGIVEWQQGELVPDIYIPLFPFKFILAFGFFLLCLECIIQAVHFFPEMLAKEKS